MPLYPAGNILHRSNQGPVHIRGFWFPVPGVYGEHKILDRLGYEVRVKEQKWRMFAHVR